MQITEAKDKLVELENNIEGLINTFQHETGLQVTDISQDKFVAQSIIGTRTYYTKLTVKAELK